MGKKSKPSSNIATTKVSIERIIKQLSALNVMGHSSLLPKLEWGDLLRKF